MITIPMLEKELKQANKDLYYYKNYSERLRNKLQQKENIIKEVREYIEKMTYDNPDTDFELEVNTVLGNALEILDKGE